MSAITISAHQGNRTITLDDAIAVTDDQAVTHGLTGRTTAVSSSSISSTILFTSSSLPTASVPRDLSAITWQGTSHNWRNQNICARCGGKGHWSASSCTKPDWKMGDPVTGYREPDKGNNPLGRFSHRHGQHENGGYNPLDGYNKVEVAKMGERNGKAIGNAGHDKHSKN